MKTILEQLNDSVYNGINLNFFNGISEHYVWLFKDLIATIYKDGYNSGVKTTLNKFEQLENAKKHNRICPRCKENYGVNKYWTGWEEIYLCDKCYKEGALFSDVATPGTPYKPINKK